MKRVVIIGGGFVGLNAAKGLGGVADVEVTLIDKHNHHLFQPLLYQVAMAGLSPADIAAPIRSLLARLFEYPGAAWQCRIDRSESENGDRGHRRIPIRLPHHVLRRDAFVFWTRRVGTWAPGLKTLEQATEIRRRVLTAFENAERASDPEERRKYLTFVVVGGGPTGVELAGAIGEMSRFTLAKDFRSINANSARVVLIEAGPRILPAFSEPQAARAMRDLEKLGVQVWTSLQSDIDRRGRCSGRTQNGCAPQPCSGLQACRLRRLDAVLA